ncbi:unnamed protein product [Microthlaspi erraticum]|uniref:Uncharacterized protein n=1 Tax=Microthlaspi erraticum TaxID=1685480 RepID=A0A6D2KWD0_9BRAS|nr:unnamed protein product [Microthlaspi erraticum]
MCTDDSDEFPTDTHRVVQASWETLKCALSLLALTRIWKNEGVTDDNRLSTTYDEVKVFPIPAALYLFKNLLQVGFR